MFLIFQACALNHSAISPAVYLPAHKEYLQFAVRFLDPAIWYRAGKTQNCSTKKALAKGANCNLIRYVPAAVYFSQIKVRGKLIRHSLKTNKLAVAKLRLADVGKVDRQRVEVTLPRCCQRLRAIMPEVGNLPSQRSTLRTDSR